MPVSKIVDPFGPFDVTRLFGYDSQMRHTPNPVKGRMHVAFELASVRNLGLWLPAHQLGRSDQSFRHGLGKGKSLCVTSGLPIPHDRFYGGGWLLRSDPLPVFP